jgi:hypothetical protein
LGEGVEAGVVDGDAGRGGEGDHDFFVVVAEFGGALFFGEVEVAEDLVAGADRDAEEAVHRRVVRWEAVGGGVFTDVG